MLAPSLAAIGARTVDELKQLVAVFGPVGGLLIVAVVVLWRQNTGLARQMLEALNANTAAITALTGRIDGAARRGRRS